MPHTSVRFAAAALMALGLSGLPAAAQAVRVDRPPPAGVGASITPASAPAWLPLSNLTVPGGNVDALAVAPADGHTLYSLLPGPAGERLYRSDDAALNWQPVYTFTAAVTQLALDPILTSTLFAGAPDALLRSTDSGLHWTPVYTLGQQIVVVSPTLIYAAGPLGTASNCSWQILGVGRSADGGATWHTAPLGCGSAVTGLAAAASQPAVVYAGSYSDVTLARSADGGQTWSPLLAPNDKTYDVAHLLLDPLNPAHLLVSDYAGLSVSLDAGLTWQRTLGPACSGCLLAASGGRLYATGGRYLQSPATVYRSEDGGLSWWAAVTPLPRPASALAADSLHPGVLYASPSPLGLFKSANGGAVWSEANTGLQTLAPIRALAAVHQAGVIYAALDQPRGGLAHSTDGGLSWSAALTGTFPVAVVTSPLSPTRAYATDSNNLGAYETRDGQTWTPITIDPVPGMKITALALPVLDPERPYLGGSFKQGLGFVLQREPSQSFWLPRVISDTENIPALAIDPGHPATVYAGSSGKLKYAVLYRSDDAGVTWQWKGWGGPLLTVAAIAVDPTHSDTVYVSSDNDGAFSLDTVVFRSDDRGEHWRLFAAGLPAGLPASAPSPKPLVVDELGTPYVGEPNGVYRWDAALDHWVPFGLSGRAVSALAIQPGAPEILLAGTDMGLWRLDLARSQVWAPVWAR